MGAVQIDAKAFTGKLDNGEYVLPLLIGMHEADTWFMIVWSQILIPSGIR